jgi:hypothetical protein
LFVRFSVLGSDHSPPKRLADSAMTLASRSPNTSTLTAATCVATLSRGVERTLAQVLLQREVAGVRCSDADVAGTSKVERELPLWSVAAQICCAATCRAAAVATHAHYKVYQRRQREDELVREGELLLRRR